MSEVREGSPEEMMFAWKPDGSERLAGLMRVRAGDWGRGQHMLKF